jgi:hypothetical protein
MPTIVFPESSCHACTEVLHNGNDLSREAVVIYADQTGKGVAILLVM